MPSSPTLPKLKHRPSNLFFSGYKLKLLERLEIRVAPWSSTMKQLKLQRLVRFFTLSPFSTKELPLRSTTSNSPQGKVSSPYVRAIKSLTMNHSRIDILSRLTRSGRNGDALRRFTNSKRPIPRSSSQVQRRTVRSLKRCHLVHLRTAMSKAALTAVNRFHTVDHTKFPSTKRQPRNVLHGSLPIILLRLPSVGDLQLQIAQILAHSGRKVLSTISITMTPTQVEALIAQTATVDHISPLSLISEPSSPLRA